jgi:hypothetical protein
MSLTRFDGHGDHPPVFRNSLLRECGRFWKEKWSLCRGRTRRSSGSGRWTWSARPGRFLRSPGCSGSPSRACVAGRSRTSSTGASSPGPAGPGPSAAVLLKIYAHCIDGQADAANQRITDALGTRDTQPRPGDEEDGDSKKAS